MEIKLTLPFEEGQTVFWMDENKVLEGKITGYYIKNVVGREYQCYYLKTLKGYETQVATHLVFPTKQALLESL